MDKPRALTTHLPSGMEQALQSWMQRTGMRRAAAARDLIRLGMESVDLWPPSSSSAQPVPQST